MTINPRLTIITLNERVHFRSLNVHVVLRVQAKGEVFVLFKCIIVCDCDRSADNVAIVIAFVKLTTEVKCLKVTWCCSVGRRKCKD